ncbi:monoacylglycerol lipase ABHD6-like [Pyrus ussuriensis x Pyrus communis]|uniref:Monoacylglycerol lipase ABHD6-like n=1 Tax=Pyrus ussuriensis x Pyrus communis TaxID=2448454 RepID=A0A5N5HZY7_9ROSA|nr:monoacylglycerol lipase ABHD6-like [Pyrus ussuriensis x Pyrus communis]
MPPSIEALAMAGADYLEYGITLNELDRQSQPSHLLVDAYRSDIDIFNSLSQCSSSSHSRKEGCNLGYYNGERKGGGNEMKRDTLIITKVICRVLKKAAHAMKKGT